MWKLWSTAGFEPSFSGFPIAVTPDTCKIQDTNDSAVDSAHHGQNPLKEKNYWTEYSSAKNFLNSKYEEVQQRCDIFRRLGLRTNWSGNIRKFVQKTCPFAEAIYQKRVLYFSA